MRKSDAFLAKMCATKDFAKDFRSGKLYVNRLSHFRKSQSKGDTS